MKNCHFDILSHSDKHKRGNRSPRRKPLGSEWRTNKLNPHMTPDLGIEPGPYWWEASALTTAPSLHLYNENDFVLVREIESTENQFKCLVGVFDI